MAKQMVGQAKFQIPGGQATPAPPVGTSLGKFGINLGQFVSQFNDRTREAAGMAHEQLLRVAGALTVEISRCARTRALETSPRPPAWAVPR